MNFKANLFENYVQNIEDKVTELESEKEKIQDSNSEKNAIRVRAIEKLLSTYREEIQQIRDQHKITKDIIFSNTDMLSLAKIESGMSDCLESLVELKSKEASEDIESQLEMVQNTYNQYVEQQKDILGRYQGKFFKRDEILENERARGDYYEEKASEYRKAYEELQNKEKQSFFDKRKMEQAEKKETKYLSKRDESREVLEEMQQSDNINYIGSRTVILAKIKLRKSQAKKEKERSLSTMLDATEQQPEMIQDNANVKTI